MNIANLLKIIFDNEFCFEHELRKYLKNLFLNGK